MYSNPKRSVRIDALCEHFCTTIYFFSVSLEQHSGVGGSIFLNCFSGRHFLGVGFTAACTEQVWCRTAHETVRVLVAYLVRRTEDRVGLTKVRE
jgi:hypothetical protein